MEINTTVTKRIFNITLSEEEMAILLDLGNWDENNIVQHFNREYSREYGNVKQNLKVLSKLWKKMNKAFLGDNWEADDDEFEE